MDRGEKYRHGLKKEKRLVQISRELGWTAEDNQIAEELLGTFSFSSSTTRPP